MDARRRQAAALLVLAVFFAVGPAALAATVYRAQSRNFIVLAPDEVLAKQVAHQAERYRRELAVEWLGYELPDWQQKCPIHVEIGPHSGGETTFAFVGPPGQAQPMEWSMRIFGPANRLLDAVLPHEVTHTIFATHFGRPLPRWADEGACTTVEHASERKKIQELLMDYLSARPSRGIPFNRLFVMMQYPDDMLPLYAQSYSLAQFLVNQKGRQHFIKFVERGLSMCPHEMQTAAWDTAVREYYGFQDLSELQVAWVAWVRAGSPSEVATATAIASARPEPPREPRIARQEAASGTPSQTVGNSWYHRQMTVANSPVRIADSVNGNSRDAASTRAEQANAVSVVGSERVEFAPRAAAADRVQQGQIMRR